ncbi:MAG: hypothetical protein WBB19_07745 [Desulforhopalus sp.]
MSIRSLALDLYRAQQKLDELIKKYDDATPGEKEALAQEVRFAQKEQQMLRRMLDGEKESGSFRRRFTGFGNSKR